MLFAHASARVRGNVVTGTRPQSADGSEGSTVPSWALISSIFSSIFRLQRHEWADGQHVHFGPPEAVNGFFGLADNRFVFVKAGIEHDRDAGFALECFDQVVVERIFLARHSLQPTCVINMIHSA